MLPLRAWVDLVAMAMKGYSVFPKAPALLELHHQIVSCHIQDTRWRSFTHLRRSSRCIFYRPSRLAYFRLYICVKSGRVTFRKGGFDSSLWWLPHSVQWSTNSAVYVVPHVPPVQYNHSYSEAAIRLSPDFFPEYMEPLLPWKSPYPSRVDLQKLL